MRGPSLPRTQGLQTEQDLRQYPDAAGDVPANKTLDDHFDAIASRIRLNANSSDWRRPGLGGGSGEPDAAHVYEEVPQGDLDDSNRTFTTAYKFHPQSLALYFNGLKQRRGSGSDFVAQESDGQGTGYDTIQLNFAPGPRDALWADYLRDDTAADGRGAPT